MLAQTPDSLSRRVQELGDQMTHLEKDAKVTQKLAPIAKDDFVDLEREVKEVLSLSVYLYVYMYVCTQIHTYMYILSHTHNTHTIHTHIMSCTVWSTDMLCDVA